MPMLALLSRIKQLFAMNKNNIRTNGDFVTYFAHIPKTAGTSFITILDRYFDYSDIYPHQLWREVGHIDQNKLASYRLFRGHFGGGGLKILTKQQIRYLTIIRNPIDLTVSTWRFVLREPNTAVHDLVKKGNFDLKTFIDTPQTQRLIENRMVRNLSFDFSQDPDAQEVFLSTDSLQTVQKYISNRHQSLQDEQRYQRAVKMLEQCIWFGLQDRFLESMQLFCYVFKVPPIGDTQKLNQKNTDYQLTDQEFMSIEQLNQWDMRLYQNAKKMFEQHYQAMCVELERNRSSSQETIDDLLDKHYQKHCNYERKNSVFWTGDHVLLGSGWHRRELTQPDNNCFRWSGPGDSAFIDFWVKPADYNLTLRIINALDTSLLDNLSIDVNQHDLPLNHDDAGVVREIHARIDRQMIQDNGLLRLSFHAGQVCSHAEAFKSDDKRIVSFALHWIKINPCLNPK